MFQVQEPFTVIQTAMKVSHIKPAQNVANEPSVIPEIKPPMFVIVKL